MSGLCRGLLATSSRSLSAASRCSLIAHQSAFTISSTDCAINLDTATPDRQSRNERPLPPLLHRNNAPRSPRKKHLSQSEMFDQIPQPLKDIIIRLGLAIKAGDLSEAQDAWRELREIEDLRPLNIEILTSMSFFFYEKEGVSETLIDAFRLFVKKKRWQPIQRILEQCMEDKRYEDVEILITTFLTQAVEEKTIFEIESSPSRGFMSQVLVFGSVAFSQKRTADIVPWISLVRKIPTYQISSTVNTETSQYSATSNGSPASFLTVLKILQTIFDHPNDAKLAYTYARHAILAWGLDYEHKTARIVYNFLSRRVLLLFANNDMKTIEEFLSIAQEANTKEYGHWLKITHLDDQNYDWNTRTWHQTIRGALTLKRPDIAEKAWIQYLEMKPKNEAPSPVIWLAFLHGYGKLRMWDQTRQTWKQMLASGTEPDEHVYTTMILNLFRARCPDEASSLFLQLRSNVAKSGKQMSISGYAPIIHGMLLNDRLDEANALLLELQSGKDNLPPPRISTYNLFLRYYARRQDFEKINEVLQQIANSEHSEADVFTFTTIMSAYTASGIEGAAEKVYKLMQKHRIKETNVTLTTMIQNLVEKGEDNADDPVDFINTFNILQNMERYGPNPTEVTYTSIISALIYHADQFNTLFRNGYIAGNYADALSKADASSARHHLTRLRPNLRLCIVLFDNMRTRGLRTNRVTCHTLIAGLLGDPLQEKDNNSKTTNLFCLRQAIDLFKFLQSNEGANAASWLLLLQRLMAWLQLTRGDYSLKEEVNERLSIAISEIKQTDFIKDQDVAETVQRAIKMLR